MGVNAGATEKASAVLADDESGQTNEGGGRLCGATTASGRPCPVHAVKESEPPRCLFHSDAHARASAKGGRVKDNRRRLRLGEIDFSDASTVRQFFETLARSMLTGEIPSQRGRDVAAVAAEALRVRQGVELSERVDALEAAQAAADEGAEL